MKTAWTNALARVHALWRFQSTDYNSAAAGVGILNVMEISMAKIEKNERQRWIEAVKAIVSSAQNWAKKHGWSAKIQTITLTEDRLGFYDVPLLTVETTDGRIVLEPIARWTSPGDGRIDVYGWPSLNKLMLIRKGNTWELLTEAGVRWPQAWNDNTFADLAANLNTAA